MAGHRLGALEEAGGYPPPFQCIPAPARSPAARPLGTKYCLPFVSVGTAWVLAGLQSINGGWPPDGVGTGVQRGAGGLQRVSECAGRYFRGYARAHLRRRGSSARGEGGGGLSTRWMAWVVWVVGMKGACSKIAKGGGSLTIHRVGGGGIPVGHSPQMRKNGGK